MAGRGFKSSNSTAITRKKERENYAGSKTPSIVEGKGVHRCLHHAVPHQEIEEGELMGIGGVAC